MAHTGRATQRPVVTTATDERVIRRMMEKYIVVVRHPGLGCRLRSSFPFSLSRSHDLQPARRRPTVSFSASVVDPA